MRPHGARHPARTVIRGIEAARALCQTRGPIPDCDTDMTLSDTDRDMLINALHSKAPDVVQARMANALLLLAEGLGVEDVAGLLYLDEGVVKGWQRMFSRRPKAA